MKKSWYALLFLILIFIGCTTSGGETTAGNDVMIEFVTSGDNALPSELYEEDTFIVPINIYNYVIASHPGDKLEGYLCLGDTLPNSYGGIPEGQCQLISLNYPIPSADGTLYPEIEPVVFPLEGGAFSYVNLDKDFEEMVSLFAKFNYKVDTTATSSICIASPTRQSQDPTCSTVGSIDQPSMPLEITDIQKTQSRTKDNNVRLVLDITIKKVEDGNIIDPNSLERGIPAKDPVIDVVVSWARQPMQCSPLDRGKMSMPISDDPNPERKLRCSLEVNPLEHSENERAPVFIQLHYGFQKIISYNIALKQFSN